MSNRFILIITFILFTQIPCISRAQKLTVDPNTVTRQQTAGEDTRLSQKVTYEARHKTIRSILADLSSLTGVTLYPGYNNQDWQVRDRRMNIFVKDVPLSNLMDSIARVMKFNWSCNNEKNPPTYRLYADRRVLARMEAEQRQKERELAWEVTARREKLVDTIDELADITDEEAQKLETDNPYLYLAQKTGLISATESMFNDITGLREAFINTDHNIVLKTSQLSSRTQQLLLSAMKNYWPYEQLRSSESGDFPADAETGLANATITIKTRPQPVSDWDFRRLSDFGSLSVDTSIGSFNLGSYTDPDDAHEQLLSQQLMKGVDEGLSWCDVRLPMITESQAAIAKMEKEASKFMPIDPIVEHPDEPDLHKKIRLEVEEKNQDYDSVGWSTRFAATQQAICKASGFGIVSDSFATVAAYESFNHTEGGLGDVLDKVTKNPIYNWEKHGAIIEMRSREWFRKRSSQLPEEWLEQWRNGFRKNGTFSFDEFAQIGSLDIEQINENIRFDPVLSCVMQDDVFMNMAEARNAFRLYLRLTPAQRIMLTSEDGLDSRSFTPEQYQLLAAALKYGSGISENAIRLLDSLDGIKLTLRLIDPGSSAARYTLTASDKESGDKFNWDIVIPKYEKKNNSQP